jgi:hypothetical protein
MYLSTTQVTDCHVDSAGRFVEEVDKSVRQPPISARCALEPDRTVRYVLNSVSCFNSTWVVCCAPRQDMSVAPRDTNR